MKILDKINITPVFVEFIPETLDMIQNEVYISEKYLTSSHLCLCGCGKLSVTPLNTNGWSISGNYSKISLTPSILNRNCYKQSHYIITNNIAYIL